MLYVDTSALAKRYIIEAQGETIEEALAKHTGWVFTSLATYAETLAVLARSLREGRIVLRDYQRQKSVFLADWKALHIIQVTPEVLKGADRLIEQHGLRGFDAIHLCSALWIGQPSFACFDGRLRRAAKAEGLTTIPAVLSKSR